MPEAVTADPEVQAAGTALADAGAVLAETAGRLETAAEGGDPEELAASLAGLLDGIRLLVEAERELAARVEAAAASLPAAERDAAEGFTGVLARRMLDHLVLLLLRREAPRLGFLLELLGLIEVRVVEAGADPHVPRHVRRELRLDRLESLLRDPVAGLADAHDWGEAGFDPEGLMRSALSFYREDTAVEVGRVGGDAFFEIGPFRWARDSSTSPPGLRLDLTAEVDHAVEERFETGPTWGVAFRSSLALEGGATFRLSPPTRLSAEPLSGSIGGEVGVEVHRNEEARGFTILGGNDLLEVTAEDVGAGAELTVGADTGGETEIDAALLAFVKGLTLTLGTGDADSFLASLVAGADVEGVADLAFGWTLDEGLVIRAAGGLEIAIPMHQSLAVATLETLYLILTIDEDGAFLLETSAGITGRIGPLTATVERMGAELSLAVSDGADADLGLVEVALRFKPPNGVGLALEAGAVRGGGYLYLDPDRGQYAGALELVFSGGLALKAIGLVTTRMPDGSEGFSLLVVVTAEFATPLQLGFGFTLVGVGGLLGLHRTMRLEELAEGVRTGAVDGVMFPTEVVANAPRIISDMGRFFPARDDTFLIGPMAKLGWGTPSLITATLGVVIEVPPGNVAILGVVTCALPDEEAALLVLNVQFIGALEVDRKRLWFFASMFDSRILYITLDGEMGFLVAWGRDAAFLASAGGFHPQFQPPPTPFPVPRRLSFSILDRDFARIRVQGYFAVTSNTAQFGAAVELYFGLSEFSVEGHLGFDALFQFSPFYFLITFSASMSVKVFGAGLFSVRIRGELEGTSPWHVEGEGSISLLLWDLDVPFSHTWGERADTVLPAVDVMPIVRRELEKRDNWVAVPPRGARLPVSLRTLEEDDGLVLHPTGRLRISQRAVPLELSIQKVGNQRVRDAERVEVRPAGPDLVEVAEVHESFATGQFREMEAADRLSAPGYEEQVGGSELSVEGAEARTDRAVKRVVFHELILVDTAFRERLLSFFNVGRAWFERLLVGNATARSPLSEKHRTMRDPFEEKVVARPPGWVIARAADNRPWDGADAFRSRARALDALSERESDGTGAGKLHVIPAAEARGAA